MHVGTPPTGAAGCAGPALPQMALDQPLNALSAMQLSSRLLGARQTEREMVDEDSGETRYQLLRRQVHARLVDDTAYCRRPTTKRCASDSPSSSTRSPARSDSPSTRGGIATVTRIHHELLGFGPLERLLADPTITEIMVNGRTRSGSSGRAPLADPYRFETADQLMQVIDRMVSGRPGHRRELADGRRALEDGSRIHVVIPPVSLQGPDADHPAFLDHGPRGQRSHRGGHGDRGDDGLPARVRASPLNILISAGPASAKTPP